MLIQPCKYLVFISLAILLAVSACASKPTDPQEELKNNIQVMREAINEAVKEADRREKLLTLSDSLKTTLLTYNKAYADFVKEFGQLNRNYDTPREKQEALLGSFRETRQSAMKEVVTLHQQMVEITSEEEWKKIVKKELDALKTVRQLPEDQLGG